MATDPFSVVAEPQRRRILDQLRAGDATVGDLAVRLRVSQPTVSKHLKVLRDAGFVTCEVAAQKRIYRLAPGPFEDLDRWLAPYLRLWNRHLDALGRHLDRKDPTS
ncbi:DNA-binding transcriptional ArsR family regulator [Nocardia transvalensis]|uniref:DNA-binding transcriptional ArsR family regulator n=1 Tax=Nocardia transvalensis TaxID=37333 RepID=A0A7W9PL48_9NOCA|nr:metalloregulator ArsR/SmtB family transcription factor [Nocardia transvalensis]MBB5918206.1 DNA-binding transcriptional ArsR family regulator [Nocardia transvalensis]